MDYTAGMELDARIRRRLAELEASGLYRDPQQAADEALAGAADGFIDVRSNDYLGLAGESQAF